MAFYIKKQSILMDSKTVYYTGDSKWSDAYTDRKSYSTGDDAAAEMANPDGKNGGFTGSTIVAE